MSRVRLNDKDQYAKQPAQWNDLPASSHDVLEHFVTARLLIASGDENERTLEVAHEALFRAWPRLADWLKDNKSFLVWQQRLRASITRYEETKENPDLFLRGFPLTEALEWLKKKPDSFSAKERQFVRASKGCVARRRLLAVVIGGFVLSVIGALAWSWKEGERSNMPYPLFRLGCILADSGRVGVVAAGLGG